MIEGIYWEVCSRRHLARRLGISRAEVEKRHQRGLKRMREHFGV